MSRSHHRPSSIASGRSAVERVRRLDRRRTDRRWALLGCWIALSSSAGVAGAAAPAAATAAPEAAAPETAAAEPELTIDEVVVVTATAREEDPSRLPFVTESMSDRVLRAERLVRTVPEALAEVGGVMVQKTSHGQGSPYLRGFTGFHTLFLIDGIRLNNSAWRSGPNQYWNTVDAFGLERLEVVQGPATVLYGSESVGGTVQALTRQPVSPGRGAAVVGSLYTRWASAERSRLGRLDLSGAPGPRWSWALGGSLKDFGDVESGGGLGSQPRTGYDEWDLDFKLRVALGPDSELTAAFQKVAVDDAWRTHKTIFGRSWRGTTVGSELRRVLDQGRTLAYLQLRHDRPGPFFDSVTASLSLQRQEEERDRLRTRDRHDVQGFDVATLGAWVRFEKAARTGVWTWGLESYRDGVDSFKHRLGAGGEVTRSIQGPVADDADYRLWGAYVQRRIDVGRRLRLDLGARYTRAEADARAVEEPGSGERIRVTGEWDQVVGSARFTLPLGSRRAWQLFGGASQAFRPPNLSDLTRFDSARSDEIETPAPGLDPESFLAWELGVRRATARASLEIAAFYTDVDGMIVRVPTGRVIDGDFEVTKANGGDGFSRGLTVEARRRLDDRWTLFGTLSWVDGEIDTFPTASSPAVREPLDRLMPPTAHLGVRWREPGKDYWLEASATLADDQDELSSRDAADTQRIPPGGTPGYGVVTLRGGWEPTARWALSCALENLTDEDYRIHGSGLNQPGRNLVLAAELRF